MINTKERKLQTYDSMIKAGHKKANEKLQNSIEEILGEEQQHKADHAAIASPVEVADAHRNAPLGGGGAGWSPWHVQAVAQGDGVVNGYTVRCGYVALCSTTTLHAGELSALRMVQLSWCNGVVEVAMREECLMGAGMMCM